MAHSLRFYGGDVSFLGCLWPIILLVPIFGLTQGPSWWCTHLSAKMDSSVRVSGRLGQDILSPPSSFWPLPNSSRLVFFGCVWVFVAACGLSLVVVSGATLRCGAQASHCGGFSCCGARALGSRASVVVAHGLSSCGSWALERRLSSCGSQA